MIADRPFVQDFATLAVGLVENSLAAEEPGLNQLTRTALADSHPLAALADAFGLNDTDLRLLVLLWVVDTDLTIRRRIDTVEGLSLGFGIAQWLAKTLIPDLGEDRLSYDAPLRGLTLLAETEDAGLASRLALTQTIRLRISGDPAPDPIVTAHLSRLSANGDQADPGLADAMAAALTLRGPLGLPPAITVAGASESAVAAALAACGVGAAIVHGTSLDADALARARLGRVISRDAVLDGLALVIDTPGPESLSLAERHVGFVILIGANLPETMARGVTVVASSGDDPATRRATWRRLLGPLQARVGTVGIAELAGRFRLSDTAISRAIALTTPDISALADQTEATRLLAHRAARILAPQTFPGVRIVEPGFGWDDIILPPGLESQLRRLEAHVRHSAQVFDLWGFSAGSGTGWRGRGVAALLAGPSGTGKTMAAEVIASGLGMRLMVIDLSQIISKYIGETTKNIAAAFREAERSGAVMVWNEGDAIWGARGQVSSATDRHVNAEVGDLLQRVEDFSGCTIVTTNLKSAIDAAFMRRFRFVIDFSLPGRVERCKLWARAFPPEAPMAPGLRTTLPLALAELSLSGASIRNIALAAAFRAAQINALIDKEMIEAELTEELRKHSLPTPTIRWGLVDD